MDSLSSSLIGLWKGTEKKIVYTGCDGGCFAVERTFTFSVTFLEGGRLSGSLAQSDSEGEGSTPFSGKWNVNSDSQTIEALVDQTCYNEETEIKGPIASLKFSYQDGRVSHVVIDDSQNEIDDEEHCDDVHLIVCTKE